MYRESILGKIEKEVETLTLEEQLKLLEEIIRRLRKKELKKRPCVELSKLYGIGKGLWKGEDAQEYVNKLREDRI
ncbi:hypothetical protein J7K43_00410 [Candidatus Calescamantes bacterium]|nr:hypothetical protein [Candidatus Calescamantes bacterium]